MTIQKQGYVPMQYAYLETRTYTVATVLSRDRQLRPLLRTGDILLPFPPYAPFSLTGHFIDSFTFVATNMYIVQGLQCSI